MAIEVVPASDVNAAAAVAAAAVPVAETPAAQGSPLANLRSIRQAKLDKLHLDLEVPRWAEGENPIRMVVRYRPISVSKALAATQRREASKDADWIVLAQIDQLIDACVGVYSIVGDTAFTLAADNSGNWVSFDLDNPRPDEWVRFNGDRAPELAAALGVDLDQERSKSAPLVRALYFTDGDIGLACQRLANWSAEVSPEADQAALGE